METAFKESLWKQFGASIDMLENALKACPDELWDKFWYRVYHTLFFLDYYITPEPENYLPPPPFTLAELEYPVKMPERVYDKEELLSYLQHCRQKCHDLITVITPEMRWVDDSRDYSITEILLYNMRHVQHHTGQLNLILRQGNKDVPDWVSRTKTKL
jgi:hypothetical protein